MRKKIVIIGAIVLIAGFIFNFLAGATLPGGFQIPLLYGSNQTFWLFVSFVGLIVGIAGLFLKSKKRLK
jgi:hypothetical protein